MIMKLDLTSADNELKCSLESFFKKHYPDSYLISHGLDHHRRVWSFARELLEGEHEDHDKHFISNLLVACYLHDIGMAVDPGIKHGIQSRKLCQEFLDLNHIPEKEYVKALKAIEKHDDKEYKNKTGHSGILRFLSVADDLDAFGFIGIFRYVEIYLERGMPPGSLGDPVIENAGKRFLNFKTSFPDKQDLYQKHFARLSILTDFFGKYNDQLPGYTFGTGNPSGYCGVIELLRNISAGSEPDNAIIQRDPVIRNFFESFRKEIEEFSHSC